MNNNWFPWLLLMPWWLLLSLLSGWIAMNKGRSGLGVFITSLLLSPIFGMALALGMRREDPYAGEEAYKRCPECAEHVKRAARLCKHCGNRLERLGESDSAQATSP